MQVNSEWTKVRTSLPVSLTEAKRHLRIEEAWIEDDPYIESLIDVACTSAEQWIGRDIADTTVTAILYYPSLIPIIEDPIRDLIQVVDLDSSTLMTTTDLRRGLSYWTFELPYQPESISVKYTTGWTRANTPKIMKQAILIRVADLYDDERASLGRGGRETQAFEKLLQSWKITLFG